MADNETNATNLLHELTGGMEGFAAGPVKPLEKTLVRQPPAAVAGTTRSLNYAGPPLNATGGNDVSMEEIHLQTETISPA